MGLTEKRFTTSDTDILCMTIIDNENGKHYGFAKDIAIVMNDLNDENKQLRQQIKELEIENTAQSDAIDGLQAILAHFDLEEVIK